MRTIEVTKNTNFHTLNDKICNTAETEVTVQGCLGQRYIASGMSGKTINIYGTPGNALGAYLNGCVLHIYGNAQDAIGDTMNEGTICVHGSAGDATGYAMRGGMILIEGNVGYRAGIHMKAYEQKCPQMVIGGCAGDFLGEYQAGGTIVVLGLNCEKEQKNLVGAFCGTGMHGGKIFLRCKQVPNDLPAQVKTKEISQEERQELECLIKKFCNVFEYNAEEILKENFLLLTADSKNPYKQFYTAN